MDYYFIDAGLVELNSCEVTFVFNESHIKHIDVKIDSEIVVKVTKSSTTIHVNKNSILLLYVQEAFGYEYTGTGYFKIIEDTTILINTEKTSKRNISFTCDAGVSSFILKDQSYIVQENISSMTASKFTDIDTPVTWSFNIRDGYEVTEIVKITTYPITSADKEILNNDVYSGLFIVKENMKDITISVSTKKLYNGE